MKMVRLTDNGRVWSLATSPDGRYVAYSLQYPDHSLWVQQVASGSKVEVVPSAATAIIGVTFSPDNNYLYFVRDDKGYVIPALGGTPRLVVEGTFGGIGVSPDGRKLAFVRRSSDALSQLIVVNRDGTGEHAIVEYSLESGMVFNTQVPPSWSPDGKLIAMPVGVINKAARVLNVYPVEGGPARIFELPGLVVQALWLPDQVGLLVAIRPSFSAPSQVWLQPFPSGSLQRLTNDLDGYNQLSVSNDGRLLAAVQAQMLYTIFVGPASKPDQGTAITTGKSDGIGLAWMPDGTLLSQTVDSEFYSLAPDGKRQVALFKEDVFPGRFSVCKNGLFILFDRASAGLIGIWRTDTTRHYLKQITQGAADFAPACSPNADSVIYKSDVGKNIVLRRVSIDGGPTFDLTGSDTDVIAARYSPDGQEIADLEGTDKNVLVVRNAKTGLAIKHFDIPAEYDPPWNCDGWVLRWTPDGRAITYALWKGNFTPVNLWSQPLSGGPPRRITDFRDAIVAYDWSPDGKQLALTRRTQSQDVVLISNFH
jgi:Tol biopolymer transport system component